MSSWSKIKKASKNLLFFVLYCILYVRIIVYNNTGEANMKNAIDNMQFRVEKCKRCEDEKKVNKFGLCKSCAAEVDHEYAVLYRINDMDY